MRSRTSRRWPALGTTRDDTIATVTAPDLELHGPLKPLTLRSRRPRGRYLIFRRPICEYCSAAPCSGRRRTTKPGTTCPPTPHRVPRSHCYCAQYAAYGDAYHYLHEPCACIAEPLHGQKDAGRPKRRRAPSEATSHVPLGAITCNARGHRGCLPVLA